MLLKCEFRIKTYLCRNWSRTNKYFEVKEHLQKFSMLRLLNFILPLPTASRRHCSFNISLERKAYKLAHLLMSWLQSNTNPANAWIFYTWKIDKWANVHTKLETIENCSFRSWEFHFCGSATKNKILPCQIIFRAEICYCSIRILPTHINFLYWNIFMHPQA